MHETLEFPDLLRLIDERADALRAAAASAPDLDAKVPTCPEWTLRYLVRHVGEGQSYWAAVVGAGPAAAPPGARADFADAPPLEREALLAWSTAATQRLVDALRRAGADGGCWTWWDTSDSPQTTGAVARHQVQEVSVHAYDAQTAAGDPQPVPVPAALDGIEEFLSTCVATSVAWPHEPVELDFHAAEGESWRLALSGDGARSSRIPATDATHDSAHDSTPGPAALRGTAEELLLMFYGRLEISDLRVDGDVRLFELLRDWEPE